MAVDTLGSSHEHLRESSKRDLHVLSAAGLVKLIPVSGLYLTRSTELLGSDLGVCLVQRVRTRARLCCKAALLMAVHSKYQVYSLSPSHEQERARGDIYRTYTLSSQRLPQPNLTWYQVCTYRSMDSLGVQDTQHTSAHE